MSDFEKWFEKRHGKKPHHFTGDYANYTHLKHELKKAWDFQQEKIDAIKSKLHDIYDACDEDETVAEILDSIQELLK